MFCKNCGREINPGAAVCLNCGVAKGVGYNFCGNCGAEAMPGAAVCTTCGFALGAYGVPGVGKSKTAAAILAFLLGGFGAHNWYLGYTGKAIGQLLLTFCFGIGYIWAVIDGIMILTGSINTDANGMPLV